MKTLFVFTFLSITALHAEAAIPRRGDLTAHKWCSARPSEDRRDEIFFRNNGKMVINTFRASGSIEAVKSGEWKLNQKNLNVQMKGQKRSDSLAVVLSNDGQSLQFSTGTKAVACD